MDGRDPLVELLDETRADGAGAARTRQRWLEHQASEGATLVGTLVDLAERGALVSLRTTAGRMCHGAVVAVSDDVVVVRAEGGRDHCLRLDAVASLRLQPVERAAAASGGRPAPFDLSLVELLARLAPDRPRIALVTADGDLLAGVLVAVGLDVVTLAHEADHRLVVYVAAGALVEAVIERP